MLSHSLQCALEHRYFTERNIKDYFCIFGGGGIRGVSYAGALKAMNELNINFKGSAGSSVGAVIAALTGVGYSPDEVKQFFMDFGVEIFRDINFDITKGPGFSKGELFYAWVKELIENKFYGVRYIKGEVEEIKFKDIEKDIIIISVDLEDSSFKEFSKYKTPDAEIAKAVRASVSMPGLFKPVEFGREILVDGDLMKSWPLWRLSKNLCPDNCRVIEFRLEDEHKNKKTDNLVSYLNAIYDTFTAFASNFVIDLYVKKDKFDYIKINTEGVSVIDFMISKNKKEELVDIGYKTTAKYFKEFLPQKRRKLFKSYYELYILMLEFRAAFNLNNIKKANCALGEIFIYLCECKRTIDIELYNEIVKFKDLFKANFKQKKFLFFSFEIIENKKAVEASFLKALKIAEEKASEFKV
jgi:NTE family protein